METVTVFENTYRELMAREMEYATELAKLRGTIIGLSQILDRDPGFVELKIRELAEEFSKG